MTFRLSDDRENSPVFFYEQLVRDPIFRVLKDGEPSTAFMFREKSKFRGGRHILGTVYMPSVNGSLSDLFDWLLEEKISFAPDYLFILDFDFWRSADPRRREILMFHEMKHCDQAVDEFGCPRFTRDGQPIWRLVGHDVEEFNEVVNRYGAYSDDLKLFRASMDVGEAK